MEHFSGFVIIVSGSEPGASVENLSAEHEIQFRVPLGYVPGTHEVRNSKAFGIRNNFLSLFFCWKAETGKIAFVPIQLVKQDNVGFSILEVFIEVADCSVGVRVFEVVIEPTEDELIRRKFEKIREFLVFAFQPYEERIFLEVDSLSSLKL